MSKTYKFKLKDQNRFKKVYNYIRKKPKFEFVSEGDFKMVVGTVDFTSSAGPVTFIYPTTGDQAVSYTQVPIVTAIAVDSESNSSADVNVFVTTLTTTAVTFAASAPFTGQVHFHIISQD